MTGGRAGLLHRLRLALRGPAALAGRTDPPLPSRERFLVVRDDLLREYTREEVERHERAVDPLGGVESVAFGHLNPVWQRFCAALEPGDRIWRFNAQRIAASGEAVIRCGYVAVRAGVPQRPMVATFRTVAADAGLSQLTSSTTPVTEELIGPGRAAIASPGAAPMGGAKPPAAGRQGKPPIEVSANRTEGGMNAPNSRHREPSTVE